MDRRSYIKRTTLATFTILVPKYRPSVKDLIVGHGDFRYKIDMKWGQLDRAKTPVNDCHEMVQDKKGRIILLTNHVQNNLIYYDTSGKLLKTALKGYHGAHGLTYANVGGEEMLYMTDSNQGIVCQLSIEGDVLNTWSKPLESGIYTKDMAYSPTETAISSNGDMYVADGYGSQYVIHYGPDGELKNIFGGKGDEDDKFHNAHGIAIDTRSSNPSLLITARMKNQLKKFSLEGDYQETINYPGAFICRPVIKGDNIYLATIWSGDGSANTGIISILDRDNKLISAPGSKAPQYQSGKLSRMSQSIKFVKHPHDVCVDKDDNMYVAQWNADNIYPIKLIRI